MSSKPSNEREMAASLVARIHAGDRHAEEEYVRAYRARLVYLVAREFGESGLAEDIANEALLTAIQKLRERPIDEPESLGGYTWGIARNMVRGARRKAAREAELDPQLLEAIAGEEPLLEEQLARARTSRLVRDFLANVHPPRYREILLRYYVYQQDKESICLEMGVTSVHFNRVLFRAKQAFKKQYEADHAVQLTVIDGGAGKEEQHG